MDVALKDHRDEEKIYTQEEVVKNVKKFFCNEIFQCEQDDIMDDSIICVCGTWGLKSLLFKKKSDKPEQQKELIKHFYEDLTKTTLFPNRANAKEIPEPDVNEKADALYKYSNIEALKGR